MQAVLDWRELTIPDGSPAVAVARLRLEPDGAFWALVRFPAGWARPGRGHYLVEEDFWVLEGELTMSGVTYGPEQGAHIPARAERSDTRTPRGALAVARFGGPATWVRAE